MSQYKAPLYVMLHPIEGFDDLKYSKSHGLKSAFLIAVLLFLSVLAHRQLSGFSLSINVWVEYVNVPLMLLQTVGLCAAFTVVNWALCTLYNGNGKLAYIWINLMYSLLPFILSITTATILSHFLSANETMFLDVVVIIGALYSILLMIKGLQSCHEYSFGGSVSSIFFTVIGMLLMAFIAILLFSITQQFVSFIVTVFREISFRRI